MMWLHLKTPLPQSKKDFLRQFGYNIRELSLNLHFSVACCMSPLSLPPSPATCFDGPHIGRAAAARRRPPAGTLQN
jgi:hypothetical protein